MFFRLGAPAWAMSGRPPPLPPTIGASSWWCFRRDICLVRSSVTIHSSMLFHPLCCPEDDAGSPVCHAAYRRSRAWSGIGDADFPPPALSRRPISFAWTNQVAGIFSGQFPFERLDFFSSSLDVFLHSFGAVVDFHLTLLWTIPQCVHSSFRFVHGARASLPVTASMRERPRQLLIMDNLYQTDVAGVLHVRAAAKLHAHLAHSRCARLNHTSHRIPLLPPVWARLPARKTSVLRPRFAIMSLAISSIRSSPRRWFLEKWVKSKRNPPLWLRTGRLMWSPEQPWVRPAKYACRNDAAMAFRLSSSNNQLCFCADLNLALVDNTFVDDEIFNGFFRVSTVKLNPAPLRKTGRSPIWPPASPVKRGSIQNDFGLLACNCCIYRLLS